jgi:hypothetical protein
VFFSTAEEVPGFTAASPRRQARFIEAFAAVAPDFQTEEGYKPGRFGEELLTLASKWVANHFGCVSLTLEMPFKDNANLPDELMGWNGARSKRLGAAMLDPIRTHLAFGIGGKCYYVLNGDVADVTAAVRTGADLAGAKGLLVQYAILPRPHPQLVDALL